MSGRDRVLARVRAALGPDRGGAAGVPRDYRRGLGAERADVVALFTERVADLRVPVRHVGADELGTAVAAALWGREAKRIAVPAGLPYGWLADLDGVRALADVPPLDDAALAALDAVVTGCAAAVAETGAVVLDGGRGQGRRALARAPAHHLCVVHADQIAGTVPEALARLDPRRPLTWLGGTPGLEVLVVDQRLC
ncbi:LutC/YkgG family protein [Actinomadura parmotrematis]|uniref:LutC/YkgG family protein n=1 Tax=Actinomadura parmotrematis TaxID=2864039 RepID=UPI0027E37512|nr:LUD domain-containing protein [Actinomadura parmotrematis]